MKEHFACKLDPEMLHLFPFRLASLFFSIAVSIRDRAFVRNHRLAAAKFVHTQAEEPTTNATVGDLCDALRRGCNWDTLIQRFGFVEFSDLIIEKVLLQLKEPTDARRALGFFHWSSQRKKSKCQHGVRPYCIVIHILVRARLLVDSRALLESVLRKCEREDNPMFLFVDTLLGTYRATDSTPLVFDLLIQTYAKLRQFEVAFHVFHRLDTHGFSVSIISYNSLLHVVQKSNQHALVWKIYEHMIEKRTYPNEVTVRIMIGALCKEGKLQNFVNILDRINGKRCSPLVIVNTSLVYRLLEEGRIEVGMLLLKRMLQKNMILDSTSYSLVIFAKIKIGNLDSSWKVYEEMLKRGFKANSFVLTLFIGVYCKEGRIEEAEHLVQELENMGLKPYDETFNFLVEGYAKAYRLEESLRYYEKTIEMGILPSCLSINEMIGKLCDIGEVKKADAVLTILLDKGFLPNETTYCHLINGYEKVGEFEKVVQLYYEMEQRSLFPDLLVFKSLIRSLCRCGKLKEAEKYLKVLKERELAPSACIYELLIACHLQKGDKTRALHLYNEVVKIGLKLSCSCLCGKVTSMLPGLN